MCRIKRRGKGSTLGAMGRFILGNLRMITETEGDSMSGAMGGSTMANGRTI